MNQGGGFPMIRQATLYDAIRRQAICAPNVRDTALSLETEAPRVEEIRRRIETTFPQPSWLVEERDGTVAGFAYPAPFRMWAA